MPTQQEAEAALTTLYQEVHVPAFFEKLANDYKIVPRDEAEAIEMLKQAEQLAQLHAGTPTKQASVLEKGGARLNALLKQAGMAAPPPENKLVKTAAANAALHRPDLAKAALTLLASSQAAA